MLDFFRLVPKKRTVKIRSKDGVIFSNPSGNKKYTFHFGTIIIFVAIGYFFYLYWPLAKSIVNYSSNKNKIITETEIKEEINTPEVVKEEFVVKIPKIGAISRVKANVSPFDRNEYLPVLEKDWVAHAKNTGLPGQKDVAIYLFAHSTKQGIQMVRNNSVFYLLGELRSDDPIFIDYNGKVYGYKVYDQKVVSANEIEYLSYGEPEREILILQTCWPIGTDWKRLLVFAERI